MSDTTDPRSTADTGRTANQRTGRGRGTSPDTANGGAEGSPGPPNRRQVLRGTAILAATGIAGCLGSSDGSCEAISTEGPDGETACISPVAGDRSIGDYYGFDTENEFSSAIPDDIEAEDATVTFVYRNSTTGDRHLVVVHDSPDGDSGGSTPMTFRGVSGYEWTVRDDEAANDGYETPDGTFGETESVAWQWDSGRTDGGAIGPLDNGFDVELVHRAEASVNGVSVSRNGVDRWLVVDGDDPGSPTELATFGDDSSGEVSIQLSE